MKNLLVISLALVLSVSVFAQDENAISVSDLRSPLTSQADVQFKKFGTKDGFSFYREYTVPERVSFEEIQKKVSIESDLGMVFIDGEDKVFSLQSFGFQPISSHAYTIQKLAVVDELTGAKYTELLSIYYQKNGKTKSLEVTVEEEVEFQLSTDAGILRASVEGGRIVLGLPNGIGMFLAIK